MPARYVALPNPRSAPDAQQEMNNAFESDNELDQVQKSNTLPEEIRLLGDRAGASDTIATYDFEREYDMPPAGSPPPLSAVALPNDFGNSNGLLPSSPAQAPAIRSSYFRRTVGALLPMYYLRKPADRTKARGGGTENDGVFANVMAEPAKPRAVLTEDGMVHMVPEDSQKGAPPSYADAQADRSPSYWTIVHTPSGLNLGSDMVIDNLPTGSILVFAANLFTSFFFQFIGFLLTYMLHTSHAGKRGAIGGLGLTLIQFGFHSLGRIKKILQHSVASGPLGWGETSTNSSNSSLLLTSPQNTTSQSNVIMDVSAREVLSFLFIMLGWFLFLSSIMGFWRIKIWELSIRSASPADIERDNDVRRRIGSAFGLEVENIREETRGTAGSGDGEIAFPNEAELHAARITRELRDAGLL